MSIGLAEPPVILRSTYMAESQAAFEAGTDTMVAHRRYFAQFVTPAVIATVVRVIGADRLLASTDHPHMNDIPLARWDQLAPWRVRYAANLHRPVGLGVHRPNLPSEELPIDLARFRKSVGHPRSLGSMSDYTCIAKEAARQWKEAVR